MSATISRAVDETEFPRLRGIGLHTGASVSVRLRPREEQGITFHRVDLPNSPDIPASAESLADSQRNTTLRYGEAQVATVEHLLAACFGLGVTSLAVDVDGPELPAGDGSALVWTEALMRAGRRELPPSQPTAIRRTVSVTDGARKLLLAPADAFSVTFCGDFPDGTIGAATWSPEADFTGELAGARTFCRFSEVVALRRAGLIAGGTPGNALVWMDDVLGDAARVIREWWPSASLTATPEGLMHPARLRWRDEAARHKLLDLLGDLMLIRHTGPWRVTAWGSGHSLAHELIRRVADMSV